MASWQTGALALVMAAGGLSMAAPRGDAEADYDELTAEYEEAQAEFRKEIAKIKGEEGDAAAFEYERDWSPLPSFLDQFAAKGEEYAGTDGAAPFWLFVLSNDMQGEDGMPGVMCKQALDVLLDDHQEHPRFLSQVEYMGGSAAYVGFEPTMALLEPILARATSDQLQLRALFSRGVARMDAKDEATRKLAAADLKQVAAKAGEDDPLGARAKGVLFEAEHLQIGHVAPDIEGEDLSGVKFKLSDYRGKVVVLDFWGDW